MVRNDRQLRRCRTAGRTPRRTATHVHRHDANRLPHRRTRSPQRRRCAGSAQGNGIAEPSHPRRFFASPGFTPEYATPTRTSPSNTARAPKADRPEHVTAPGPAARTTLRASWHHARSVAATPIQLATADPPLSTARRRLKRTPSVPTPAPRHDPRPVSTALTRTERSARPCPIVAGITTSPRVR